MYSSSMNRQAVLIPPVRRYYELLDELIMNGKTIIISTHNVNWYTVADRAILMLEGKILKRYS